MQHTHALTHTRAHIHSYTHMHSRTCDARMHATHIHAHAGTSNAGTHLGEHRHTHIHALMRRRTHVHVHKRTHTHTYIYTHAHTYTHTNTRTHTHVLTCWQRCIHAEDYKKRSSTLRPILMIRRITPTCPITSLFPSPLPLVKQQGTHLCTSPSPHHAILLPPLHPQIHTHSKARTCAHLHDPNFLQRGPLS